MKIAYAISFFISLLLAYILPTVIITDLLPYLISFISILLAGLMTAMIMLVSIMKGGALSIKSLISLKNVLKQSIEELAISYVIGIGTVFSLLILVSLKHLKVEPQVISCISNVLEVIVYTSFFVFLICLNKIFIKIKSALHIKFIIEKENALDTLNKFGALEKKSINTPDIDQKYGETIRKLP